MTQARFWHYHAGDVCRIKINAGQSLSHSFGGPTDEGYSWESATYSFDGETVTCEWATDARDCDGRMTRDGVTHCRADRLGAGYCDDDGFAFPDWQQGEYSQRDHAAEAAGY